MSADPQREIEEKLKAYAQRRREELGASPQMPPATRRLLQREAAKKIRAIPSPGSGLWLRLVAALWPRTAFGAAFATALAVMLVLLAFNAPWKQWKLALNTEVTRDKAKLAELAAIQPSSREQPPEDAFKTPAKAETYKNLDVGLGPNAPVEPAAVSPAASEAGGTAGGGGGGGTNALAFEPNNGPLLTKRSLKEEYDVPPPSAAAPNSAAAPLPTGGERTPFAVADLNTPVATQTVTTTNAAPAPFTITFSGSPSGSSTQRFAQQLAIAQNQRAGMLANGRGVLESFRLEQAGDQVRIVDSDGSAYSGFVEKADTVWQAQSDKATGLAMAGNQVNDNLREIPRQKKDNFTAGAAQSGPVYFFRVMGINRSLGQPVLFSGSVMPQSAPAAFSAGSLNQKNVDNLSGQAGNAAVPPQPAAATAGPVVSSFSLSHAQLRGEAVVGSSNQVEVNATPVGP